MEGQYASIDVGRLGELLRRWGAGDASLTEIGTGGISVCIIPPGGVPPVDQIEKRDGWQVWLVGLGYPLTAYPTLAAAVHAELIDRAEIEEWGAWDDDDGTPFPNDPRSTGS
ncbi:MAG TPA: hypothetical protein VGO31_14650 [Microbacteriaceae bacterium]|jgi:hypothetical protein|nr:hypothetical protein [Microbacteriaceae bacterium]